jgi:superfamily II DNA or RNA helicase
VLLDDLASRPARFERARQAIAPAAASEPRLAWDPVRPLTGRGDWLERVRLIGLEGRAGFLDARLARSLHWFRSSDGGALVLRDSHFEDLDGRATLVGDLLQLSHSRTGGPVAGDGHRAKRAPAQNVAGAGLRIDPALRALLLAERERLARVTVDRRDLPAFERALRSLHRPLYAYQLEGVRRFLAAGRLLLADDMGLGKTVQAIAACHALWHAGKVQRGLVVVPASLKTQWLREWRLFTGTPIEVVEGTPGQRLAAYRAQRRGFLIVNYEQVVRDLEALHDWKPDVVVLDEAQRIKNWATKTAACVKRLEPTYRLVLTGTPMENRLDELASILDWVDDHVLEPKWRLVPWHSTWADGTHEVSGARNLETLRERLAPCMLRRARHELLDQLPPRTDTPIFVELTEEQRDAHDALNQPIAQLAAMARKRPLTHPEFLKLMKLLMAQRMISNGLAQIHFETVWPLLAAGQRPEPSVLAGLHAPKLGELREIVAQVVVQQRRKVVVFSQWHRMLALAHWVVRDLLEESGLRAAFFTGKESQRQRTKNIVELHDDPALRVLFATDAGGVGLNLQRAASCCVNVELPWNPAVLEQRIGRIYRPGQRDPIDVYNLIGLDCIESRIASLVADKRALFSGLFDGRSDTVRFERSGSFLSTVNRLVEAQPRVASPQDGEDTAAEDGTGAQTAEREVEALLAAADEAGDPTAEKHAAQAASAPRSHGAEEPAAAAKLDSAPPAPSTKPLPATTAAEVRGLLSQLQIRPAPGGGIRIDAPAEAAAGLAAIFEAFAGLLRGTDLDSKREI